ncbi:substrate-binding domain-containing protein [Niallia circulans]|uniref:substrate-binding domain-containing protein n=1 Tax=Niallia circulans TaxID=1397 RepID=UPI00352566DD
MKRLLYVYMFVFILFGIYFYYSHLYNALDDNNGVKRERLQGVVNDEFVMVTFLAGMDYWKSALKGFEDAANEWNISVAYRGGTQYDLHEQITILEQVIAKKPAGIALSAINPNNLNATIDKAVEMGIPVVLFDSDAPLSKASAFLGTNNYEAGVKAADKLSSLINKKGKVAVITLPDQLNHQERTKGFVETIKSNYPNIEVVQVQNGEGDQLKSEKIAKEIMKNYSDIKGIFVTEANGGVGVADAAKENKKMDVKIISFDVDRKTLDNIENGTISATIAQGTWNMGYWSMQFLFKLHQKDIISDPHGLPSYVDTGITIVTKDNVKEYYAEYTK